MLYTAFKCIIPFCFLLISCNSPQKREVPADFERHAISTHSVFLSVDTSELIGKPTNIVTHDGAIYVVDYGLYKIMKLDSQGNNLLTFGEKGKGPGEFISIGGFWVFDNSYLVYDYNAFKFISYNRSGKLAKETVMKENPANPNGSPPNIPISAVAHSPDELLIPTRGRNGSLFVLANYSTDSLRFMGKAASKYVKSYDYEVVQQAYAKGNIPNVFKNFILLATDGTETGIYAFQQTTATLEKYNRLGRRLWRIPLKIPAQENLFEEISDKNRQIDPSAGAPKLFTYAKAIDANRKGVALLLNLPEKNQSTIVAWVPEDGSKAHIVTYRDLDHNEFSLLNSFSVSARNNSIYFLNAQNGIIYEAFWPF